MYDIKSLQSRPFLVYGVLFFLSIFSRLSAINRYITPDELIWVYRSIQFSEALQDARWADTITTGHPGVTITWIGSFAIYIQKLVQPSVQTSYEWITQVAWLTPTNMLALQELAVFLTAGRLSIIFLNGIGLLAIFRLVWRLYTFEVGLLTAVFLAVDPFVAGLSGLLHVDATMTLFSVLALLTLAIAIKEAEDIKQSLGFTAVSAACASLALLTKSPALLLIPLSIFVLLMKGCIDQTMARSKIRRWLGFSLLAWCFFFALTSYIALPAMWSSFSAVLEAIQGDANQHIGDALRPTFFLGGTDFDHGPIFYPVSLAFRLSPLPFLGLFLSIGLMFQWGHHRASNLSWTSIGFDLQNPTVLFLLWVCGFIGGITLAAKKFDRYALPVIPVLILLGSLGWIWMINRQKRPFLWFAVLVVGSLANALYFQPNPMSAYNLLLGGPWTAQRVMGIGWGEPISLATNWLEANYDTKNSSGIGSIPQAIAPFFSGTSLLATEEFFPQADYLIWTQNDRQLTGLAQPPLNPSVNLLHTIEYGGLTQAWIYEQPEPVDSSFIPVELENEVNFDGRMGIEATALQAKPQQIDLLLTWRKLNEVENGRFSVRLTAVAENGLIWHQSEQPLVNETYFYPEHWPDQNATVRYAIPFPDGTPPVDYTIQVALVDEASQTLQPLYSIENGFEGTTFDVGQLSPLHDPKSNASVLPIESKIDQSWSSQGVTLLGSDILPERLTTGEPIPLRLYWQQSGALTQDLQVEFQIGGEMDLIPLSRYATSLWKTGEIIQEQYALEVPTDFDGESLPIELTLVNQAGEALEEPILIGEIDITPLDRLFELPSTIDVPLNYNFSNQITLHGVDVESISDASDFYTLTLYWEIDAPPTELISAFVHLVNEDGTNYAQSDQWPGGLPADLWAEGQIIIDQHKIELPAGNPPELLELAVGLYTAENGVRLTAVDHQNNPIPDNRVFLPIPVKISQP